ncbi:short-chain dehydrogenase, partial [Mycobacterium sp. ITM-2017-0098]
PVSIAPRIAVTAHAINSIAPAAVDTIMRRQRMQPKD